MEKIKVLVVDDERIARAEMRRLLSRYPDVEIVAEASNGLDALEQLDKMDIDLVFLDIQMPGLNGLQLSRNIKNAKFVLCTAYSEYALAAFELNALDYLLKPIEPHRLEQSLQRYLTAKADTLQKKNDVYLSANHGILLKVREHFQLVKLEAIYRFESVGNHVAVYFEDKKSFLLSSLSSIESKLDPKEYVKVSRSDILKISNILKLKEGVNSGTMDAILESGDSVPVSRRHVQMMRKIYSL